MKAWAWVMVGMLAGATALPAQQWSVDVEDRWCDSWGSDSERHCEIREATVPGVERLDVDGGRNGGVKVMGWSRDEIRVLAKVWARADDMPRARAIAEDIEVTVRSGEVRADGPDTDDEESWGVSYEIMVPRSSDLALRTLNGGIAIEEVEGSIAFEAINGGVSLSRLAGDVRGTTRNGGLSVELAGEEWSGQGLDVETRNGGVKMLVPDGYSARLETGTVNGGMEIGFPVTVRGRIGRRLTTTLGQGGALVRAVTTNGGVRIDQVEHR